ncbi:MAG: hypothetical protein AMJ81_02755 [Phycisphaerae bacterium SM23_33]|nr:MAG: hypothetical protein AMJ81_02755 [Phycisphaerae bacterium SM23_33]
MKRQVRIFIAGVMLVAPFAVTAYLVWWAGAGLDRLARGAIGAVAPSPEKWLFPGAGALVLLVGIYLVGLLTHLWVFRWGMEKLEKLFARLPVVKTLYESVRDILKLFSGDSRQMGQVVRYRIPGTEADLLGIRTSVAPRGAGQKGHVAVYLPMSYQLGGFTLYVPAEAVQPLDMTVEQALKIAATADAGGAATDEEGQAEPRARA